MTVQSIGPYIATAIAATVEILAISPRHVILQPGWDRPQKSILRAAKKSLAQ